MSSKLTVPSILFLKVLNTGFRNFLLNSSYKYLINTFSLSAFHFVFLKFELYGEGTHRGVFMKLPTRTGPRRNYGTSPFILREVCNQQ